MDEGRVRPSSLPCLHCWDSMWYMYEKKVKIGGKFKWVIVDTSDPKVRSEWEKLPWGNAKGRKPNGGDTCYVRDDDGENDE